MLTEELKRELEKRKTVPVHVFRINFLEWAGASLACWLTAALAFANMLTRPGMSVRIVGVCVSLTCLVAGVIASVLAYLRYRDWSWARQTERNRLEPAPDEA